jgi:hypothetical protein
MRRIETFGYDKKLKLEVGRNRESPDFVPL